jgi:hypothetical protein
MESTSKTGGGPPPRAMPKPVSRSPAVAPLFVPKACPPLVGKLFHGGARVQKEWLKKVNRPHDRSDYLQKSDLRPKAASFSSDRPEAGHPRPMAAVLKSEHLLAQWNARWSSKLRSAKDFRPEMNTAMICGRPVVILVCSHDGAPPLEWDAYLNMAFHPIRPVVLLGPTARSPDAPGMVPKFSVISWWKV